MRNRSAREGAFACSPHRRTAGVLTAGALVLAAVAWAVTARATTPPQPRTDGEPFKADQAGAAEFPSLPALLGKSNAPPLPAAGVADLLLLLIDFDSVPIQPFAPPPAFFQSLAFGETGKTMRTYYRENSYGAFDLQGDVAGWLRSTQAYRYYVNADMIAGTDDDHGFNLSSSAFNPSADPYPRNVWGLVMEAVSLADSAVDFSRFDKNGDGIVDALIVVHVGAGAEQNPPARDDYIWSHKSNLTDYLRSIDRGPLVTDDGVAIGDYVMAAASGILGVYVHEFGHILGLPDLYRRDALAGTLSSIVGSFDVMDYGPWLDGGRTPGHFGAWSKYQLGWIDPVAVSIDPGDVPAVPDAALFSAATSNEPGSFYRLLRNPGGADWTMSRVGRGEYFLIENRVAGNDDFDRYLPSSGLAVWHVDESRAQNNSGDADEHLLTLVQADGDDWTSFTANAFGDANDLWPGLASAADITDATTPSTRLHGGAFSGVEILGIRRSGEVIETDLSATAIALGAPYAYPNPLVMNDGGRRRRDRVRLPAERASRRGASGWLLLAAGARV